MPWRSFFKPGTKSRYYRNTETGAVKSRREYRREVEHKPSWEKEVKQKYNVEVTRFRKHAKTEHRSYKTQGDDPESEALDMAKRLHGKAYGVQFVLHMSNGEKYASDVAKPSDAKQTERELTKVAKKYKKPCDDEDEECEEIDIDYIEVIFLYSL